MEVPGLTLRSCLIRGEELSGWLFLGNGGNEVPLHNPLKGIYRALVPSFPAKNQGSYQGFWFLRVDSMGLKNLGSPGLHGVYGFQNYQGFWLLRVYVIEGLKGLAVFWVFRA